MKKEMTPRERVLTALNHEEPDRVPIECGSMISSLQVDAYRNLKKYLGITGKEEKIIHWMMMTAQLDEEVYRRFRVDIRHIHAAPGESWKPAEKGEFVDEFGIRFRPSPDGYYHEIVGGPLREATIGDLERYELPDPHDPRRVAGLREKAKALREQTDYAIMLEGYSEATFGVPSWLRGAQQFYMDLVLDKPFVSLLLDKLMEFWIGLTDNVMKEVGQYIDIVKISDDFGTQKDVMISPELYREMIKPRQKKLYSHMKSLTDAKLALHTCGSVYKIIDDLIEVGVDILNPVQVSAADMDSKKLKEEFGDRIVFWGGGCDTQRTLQFGTPDEVADEVRRRIADFAPGGGYIFNQVHNIQPGTPPENVCAMFDTACEFGTYPIRTP